MEYVLQSDCLKKHYNDSIALDGLSMNVPKGAIYGFVGKNGAGKTTLIRLICGPKDYAFNSVTSMVQQFVQGKMRMGLEGTFNIADVRDLADGVIAACDKGRRGESYILTGETVTMQDMFREIGEAAGLSVKSYVLSKEIARIAVKGLAAVSRVTGKDPLLSEFNIYMLNRNNEYDCSKAERELGFHCRPFSESIRDTVTWLREEGFLKATEKAEVIEISPAALLSLLFKKLVPIR